MAADEGVPPVPDDEAEAHAMAMDAIVTALDASKPAAAKAADAWLRRFTRTSHGWSFADSALADGPMPPLSGMADPSAALHAKQTEQRQFMASHIMLSKLRSDFSDLPSDSYAAVRDQLVAHLRAFCVPERGQAAVTSRLGLCLAAFAVKVGWTTCVTDLVDQFSGWSENPAEARCLATVLVALPEETYSHDGAGYHVSREAWQAFADGLRASGASVLRLVVQMLGASGDAPEVQTALLGCLKAWIRDVGIDAAVVADAELGLLSATFSAMASPPLFDACVDLAEQLVRTYEDPTRDRAVVEVLVELVLELRAPLSAAIEAEDDETARGVARIVAAAAESWSSIIVGADFAQPAFVELFLACTCHNDSEIAWMTFKGWWTLGDEVRELKGSNPAVADERCAMLEPYVETLVGAMLHLATFSGDWATLPADVRDDFVHKLRYDVADILLDCCLTVGAPRVLQIARGALDAHAAILCEAVAAVDSPAAVEEQDPAAAGSWQSVEVALFAVRSVARAVDSRENELVRPCLELSTSLLAQPGSPERLRVTCLRLLGRYSEWLHSGHDDMLPGIFEAVCAYLAPDAAESTVRTAACAAFKSLCKDCKALVGQRCLAVAPSIAAYGKPDVDVLIEACMYAVSSLGADEERACVLELAEPISGVLGAFLGGHGAADPAAVCAALEKLTTMMRFAKPRGAVADGHCAATLAEAVSDVLDGVSEHFAAERHVVELVTRLHKHAVRACGEHYAPLLGRLLTQIESRFATLPHSSYLYLTATCVAKFARHTEARPSLKATVEVLARSVLDVLAAGDERAIAGVVEEHPDMTEDFFRMMARSFEELGLEAFRFPAEMISSALDVVAVAVRVRHSQANRAELAFIEAFFEACRPSRRAESDAAERGSVLGPLMGAQVRRVVDGLVAAVLGALPAWAIDDQDGSIAAALYQLLRLAPEDTPLMLDASLAEQMPEEVLPPQGRAAFCADVSACQRRNELARPLYRMNDLAVRALGA